MHVAVWFHCFLWLLKLYYGSFANKICAEMQNSLLHVNSSGGYFWSRGFTPIVTLSLIFGRVNKSHSIGRTLIYSQVAARLSPLLCVCSQREVQSSGPSMRTAGCVSALSSIITAQKISRPPAACDQIHTFHISDPYFSALGKRFLRCHLLNWTLMPSATVCSLALSFSKLSFLQHVPLACTAMHI